MQNATQNAAYIKPGGPTGQAILSRRGIVTQVKQQASHH